MHIHQVNVSYSGEQDRMLIRINSLNGEEFRAWLTRRIALQLLPRLGQTAQDQLQQRFAPPLEGGLDAQRQQLVQNFQQEAAVYEGDFQTPYQEKAITLPLGEEPLLVTELALTPLAEAKLQMRLLERLPGRQRDIQLVMDPALTQGLLRLLNQSLKASGWQQLAALPAQAPAGVAVPVRSEADLAEAAEGSDAHVPAKPRYLN